MPTPMIQAAERGTDRHAILVVANGDLVWSQLPGPVRGDGEILIDIRATALNRADLLQRDGKYPPPPRAGPSGWAWKLPEERWSVYARDGGRQRLLPGQGLRRCAVAGRCPRLVEHGHLRRGIRAEPARRRQRRPHPPQRPPRRQPAQARAHDVHGAHAVPAGRLPLDAGDEAGDLPAPRAARTGAAVLPRLRPDPLSLAARIPPDQAQRACSLYFPSRAAPQAQTT